MMNSLKQNQNNNVGGREIGSPPDIDFVRRALPYSGIKGERLYAGGVRESDAQIFPSFRKYRKALMVLGSLMVVAAVVLGGVKVFGQWLAGSNSSEELNVSVAEKSTPAVTPHSSLPNPATALKPIKEMP